MTVRPRFRRALLPLIAAGALALGGLLAAGSAPARAATQGPCDIYASGGTPCVAAHSTTRALYAAYNGPLYQVKRVSDGATTSIYPVAAGSYANAATQDSFCANTYCSITVIYDQSGKGNNLTQAPAGGAASGPDTLANAAAAPATIGGHKVYGVDISPGMGYRDDSTSGIATGDASEGEYAIFDGTHYNNGCCFDYGNAETNNNDDGAGTMEAIYFGNETAWGTGAGSGPWIMADLENGLFSGSSTGNHSADKTVNYRFTTAMVTGGANQWAIYGGNAQSGSLTTEFSGTRPSGYNPMKKQGAIILGIGGDNSKSSAGTFYEGVMTSGYPSSSTEASVQANLVSAGYAAYTLPSNPFTSGARLSLQVTTSGLTGDYLVGDTSGDTVGAAAVTSSSSSTVKANATWLVRPGLANSACVSFQTANGSNDYIRHYNFQLHLQANDGTATFAQDATFCPSPGNSGSNYSFVSYNYANKYIRHYNYIGYVASDGGSNSWDATSLWSNDSTWAVAAAWG